MEKEFVHSLMLGQETNFSYQLTVWKNLYFSLISFASVNTHCKPSDLATWIRVATSRIQSLGLFILFCFFILRTSDPVTFSYFLWLWGSLILWVFLLLLLFFLFWLCSAACKILVPWLGTEAWPPLRVLTTGQPGKYPEPISFETASGSRH